MARPTSNYVGSFNFRIFVEGINDPLDGFSKIGGFTTLSEPIEFQHGLDRVNRKMPGRTDYEDIVLERVFSGTDDLFYWRKRIEAGMWDVRAMTIEILKPDGSMLRRFLLTEAFPLKWEGPELAGDGSNTSIERITITFNDFLQLD